MTYLVIEYTIICFSICGLEKGDQIYLKLLEL